MNKTEAGQLLELIQLSYPYAYQNLDNRRRIATIRMWAASFERVPYPIIQECFNSYRMENRYAPTVADMNLELSRFRARAEEAMYLHRFLGNREKEAYYRNLAEKSTLEPYRYTELCLPESKEREGQQPLPDGMRFM